MPLHRVLRAGILALCLLPGAVPAAAEAPAVRTSAFSGLPVPRFETLRHGEVNGRNGPGKAHKVKWVYRRAGLPVLIVRETEGWRQVRDPDGDLVWIEASQLSARSAALIRGPEGVTALRKPDAGAEPVVQFEAGVIVTLKGCEAGWCRISASGRQGYAPAAMLWGADPLEASL